MNPEQTRLQYLFERYFEKTASAEERTELAHFIGVEANRDHFMQLFMATWEKYQGDGVVVSAEKSDEILQSIIGKRSSQDNAISMSQLKTFRWWRFAAAAAILLFIAGGYWLIVNNGKSFQQPSIAKVPVNDANPGSYKARLTLADGSSITLDSAGLGLLAQQGNTTVINEDGQLVYKAEGVSQSVVYNTITTAKGETFIISLADGSKVWLNSGSSIHFPVAFPGAERKIEVTGEVYIKVAKNPAKSFIASVNGMEVRALGTEFNINAYNDEDKISTTLFEGIVKVSKSILNTTLEPGQQSQLNADGQLSKIEKVNLDEIIAWKDGFFHFESADLKTILRQFSRWYDVEVIYEGPVKNRKFFTVIKRSSTLKKVLEMLQDNDIVYRIEGGKLFVKSG